MTPLRQGRTAAVLVGSILLAGCGPGTTTPTPASSASPSISTAPSATAGSAQLVTASYEVGPPPGPVQPFRGVIDSQVQVYDGWVSMLVVLKNTGEEPVTFLNTLYDYEPLQLYEPLVRLEWSDGTAVSSSRRGRFFPTPAILQPGEEGIFLMGGQPVLEAGDGKLGDLVTHIKYCPTRGMDDVPGVPLTVSDLTWNTGSDGITTVTGVLHNSAGVRRFGAPTVGAYFTDSAGQFLGAVVADNVGDPLGADESRPFEISGPGVRAGEGVTIHALAWIR
jgi:hypothetical protein